MPGPSSSTVITQVPDAGSSPTVTVTVVRANVMAFSMRLARSWASRSGSAATGVPPGDCQASTVAPPGARTTICSPVVDRAVLDRLSETANGGERRAQVVRHGEKEMALPGATVLEALGHGVDGAG